DVRASCDWMQLAAPACGGRRSPTALRTIVSTACRSLAVDGDPATATQAWAAAADLAATAKVQHRLGRACGRDPEPARPARATPRGAWRASSATALAAPAGPGRRS